LPETGFFAKRRVTARQNSKKPGFFVGVHKSCFGKISQSETKIHKVLLQTSIKMFKTAPKPSCGS
jgi:hypothetical protein